MTLTRPTQEDVARMAADMGMSLHATDRAAFTQLVSDALASHDRLDALAAEHACPAPPRGPGTAPARRDNPFNAWAWRVVVEGALRGPLRGKRVAIKDNICVAGVPLHNGCAVMRGYLPDEDATVVTRILAAGGTVVGKTTCEDLCLSGASFTSYPEPVTNPHKTGWSAGGSSSGSAVVLATGEAELALGCDQGGSIRIPASWTGVCGLKPTHGLVPYTGIFPIEPTLDHCGPMARSVADVALLLSVIAGPDGRDPRQRSEPPQDYLAALPRGVRGMRIGLVKEGFGRPESEAVVDASVRAAAGRLESLGARVTEVSIPLHRDAQHIWNGIGLEGVHQAMLFGGSHGTGWNGHYVESLVDFFGHHWRAHPEQLSTTTRFVLLAGEHLRRTRPNTYYARAQNLGNVLRAAYDEALSGVELLLMPTTPMRAQSNISPDTEPVEYVRRAFEMIGNTCAADITHHPALSIPCGMVDGLPVGMMLVGRMSDDATVLQAAAAVETSEETRRP